MDCGNDIGLVTAYPEKKKDKRKTVDYAYKQDGAMPAHVKKLFGLGGKEDDKRKDD